MIETPTISASTYTTSTLNHDLLWRGHEPVVGQVNAGLWPIAPQDRRIIDYGKKESEAKDISKVFEQLKQISQPEPKETKMTTLTRLVKVIIADNNENLPLESRLLYNGEEKLTDMTDQDLYFDLNLSELLKAHNDLRKTTLDKKATEKSGRDVFLEPIRVSQLRMVVVNIASF